MDNSPGFYSGTSFEDYEAVRAANNSSLLKLDQSPAHMIAYQNEPTPRSEVFFLGHAIHYALLEPEEFNKRYTTGPPGDRRTKDVKAEWAKLREKYGDDFVLSPKSSEKIAGICAAVANHSIAGPLLNGPSEREVVAIWDDPATGVRCKARIDLVPQGGDAIVDIKSTVNASPEEFAKSLWAYGYHRQAEFYLRGCRALGDMRISFLVIAVEKDPPYAVNVFNVDSGALDAGEQLNNKALARYAECTASGKFPAYPEIITDITLPSWAWSLVDQKLGD